MTSYSARLLLSIVLIVPFYAGCKHRDPNQPVEIATPPPSSLDQMLEGKISGVSVTAAPGGGIIVRMGGPNSFYSGQDPLFVIDGQPIEAARGGKLSWIDPHDIESIAAVKDPAQLSLYGLRGSNGVIVIKTKGSH
ncbi:MAG TPA: TonB-dependent receptor plug domain-containing protein [Gemmatimonadales bacterium]|nr:TonB-dependent receptor plug domain-containing protein [Gemmatimonadales bacterium]